MEMKAGSVISVGTNLGESCRLSIGKCRNVPDPVKLITDKLIFIFLLLVIRWESQTYEQAH